MCSRCVLALSSPGSAHEICPGHSGRHHHAHFSILELQKIRTWQTAQSWVLVSWYVNDYLTDINQALESNASRL